MTDQQDPRLMTREERERRLLACADNGASATEYALALRDHADAMDEMVAALEGQLVEKCSDHLAAVGSYDNVVEIADGLVEDLAECVAMLRMVEWYRDTLGVKGICPVCEIIEEYGHEEDCALASLLARLGERT